MHLTFCHFQNNITNFFQILFVMSCDNHERTSFFFFFKKLVNQLYTVIIKCICRFIKEVAIAITQYIKTVKIWMLDLLYLITIMLVLNIMLQVTGMKKQINTAFHTNKFSVFDNYC